MNRMRFALSFLALLLAAPLTAEDKPSPKTVSPKKVKERYAILNGKVVTDPGEWDDQAINPEKNNHRTEKARASWRKPNWVGDAERPV